MVIYNVTYHASHGIREAWLFWLTQTHIPQMMDTGLFGEYHLFRLLGQDEAEGLTYIVQYMLADQEAFRLFETRHPSLRNGPVNPAFFPHCMAFQTVMSETN